MPSERDQRISVCALLDVGKKPMEIAKQLGISRPTVFAIMKSETLERKAGSGTGKIRIEFGRSQGCCKVQPFKVNA